MIEILGAVYLISFLLSASLIFWQYLLISGQLKSKKLRTLNTNLKKIDLYWSNARRDFAELDREGILKDRNESIRGLLLLSLLSLGSLPGFLLLAAIILSLRYLIRPRRQQAVFHSDLATSTGLTHGQVLDLVEEIKKNSW